METEFLKHAVEQVHMPPQARARILQTCQEQAAAIQEENTMKTPKINFARKKAFAALAAAALCALGTVGAVAASRTGVFVDIKGWLGTVTGTRYEQAGQEIKISAAYADGTLTVMAALALPDEAPYRELETLAIEQFSVMDSSGQTVAEGGPTAAAALTNGTAQLSAACGPLDEGEYTLTVERFTGGAKADAPLPITGRWQCRFRV